MVVQRYLCHLLHQFWLSCATSPSEVEGQVPLLAGVGGPPTVSAAQNCLLEPFTLGLMVATEVTVICPLQNIYSKPYQSYSYAF